MEKKSPLKTLTIIWLICFVIASIFLSFSHFKSESNDSKYYTELVVRYQHEEFKNIVTPKWGTNYWGFAPESFMRDQFPGQLIMGVALTKLGIPADQALHILGMLFQIASFLILASVALEFTTTSEGPLFILMAVLLTPLAFSYNIRANHELGIMFFSFLALYSGLKLHRNILWGIFAILSSTCLLLIKGPFFIFALAFFTVGYFYSKERRSNRLLFFIVLILSSLALLLTTLGFETIFANITGESFLKEFWRIQIEQRAMAENKNHIFIVQKIINTWYYLSHYLAYSLPWGLFLLVFIIVKGKLSEFVTFFKTQLSQVFFVSSMVFSAFFSLSDRVAGRYVFPGYFLFTAWTAIALCTISPTLREKISNLKNKSHILIPIIWLMAFSLHFIFGK